MAHEQNGDGNWRPLWRETLAALSLGWDLALPIFAGVLIGYFLDQWLGTGHIFTLGLLVLGIGIGYYNIARFIRRLNQRDRQQAGTAQPKNDESEVISK
jgi:F0F1-type ATP synthase assembly protein I